MPSLLIFIIYFAIALILGTAIAYPLHQILTTWFELEFDRVASRSVLLVAIILFIPLFKLLKFDSWQELGFSNTKEFAKDLVKGIGFGVLIMLPVITGLLITQNRVFDPDWEISIPNITALFLTSLLAGLVIALLEETLFRGAMLTALKKHGSTMFAILATSIIYALVHFLQPTIEFDANSLNWGSGIALLKNSFLSLTQLSTIIDSFIALFLAGVLLAVVRIRSSKIALCMGIHAGWVLAIKIFKRVTDTNALSDYAILTGSYDKVIGYLAAICIAVFIILYLILQNKSHN